MGPGLVEGMGLRPCSVPVLWFMYGTETSTGNKTGTIGNNGSWSLSANSVNIFRTK